MQLYLSHECIDEAKSVHEQVANEFKWLIEKDLFFQVQMTLLDCEIDWRNRQEHLLPSIIIRLNGIIDKMDVVNSLH